jgi:hypothetical protein
LIDKYDHPETVWMSAHWPALVFLATIFVVLTVLPLITWRWDRKDEEAQVANYYGRARRRSRPPATGRLGDQVSSTAPERSWAYHTAMNDSTAHTPMNTPTAG